MKKRILLVATFPPPVHGSAMVSKYIINSKIFQSEFDFDCVNLSTSRKMDEIGNNSPIKLLRFLVSYFDLFWKLLTNRYDLCYLAITVHGKGFLKDAPYAILCRLFGKRLIIHQHNKGMATWVEKPVFNYLFHRVYDEAKVMLLSWRLYPDIGAIVKKEQVMICPNGIPSLQRDIVRNYRQHEQVKLFFLSNLNISKGAFDLLDACKLLKERGLNFVCDFVGGTTAEIDVALFEAETRKREIDDQVKYLGRKYGEDKHKAFCDADIFVQPTKDDCFPLTLLEACQYKLPIVSTDIGAVMDIVTPQENGLLAKVGDAESLADALQTLIEDADMRERMGKAGFKKYKEQFTLEVFEQRITEIIKNTI